MSYEKEKQLLTAAVLDAWDTFKDAPKEIKSKGAFDCVTNVDFGMERFITAHILREFPADRIIGEEFSPEQGIPQDRAWVLDPIDGTVNFSHGLNLFGVQCALFEGGEAVLSVIYIPHLNETYTAVKGEGAYLNGKRIKVIERPLDSAMISVGDYSHKRDENAETQLRLVERIYDKVGKLRHFGAASIDFTNLASGRTDGFIMFTKNLWDIYPGVLLCAEAGATVCAPDGSPYDYATSAGVAVVAGQELVNLLNVK